MSSDEHAGAANSRERARAPRWRGAGAARRLGALLVWTGLVGLGVLWVAGWSSTPAAGQPSPRPGPEVYRAYCATCHGPEGDGTHRGPSLVGVGAASADFYLRTGRMPIDDPLEEAKRGDPAFDEEQIRELVDYVASLGEGPAVPDVDLSDPDLSAGNELYRLNCASCHNWDGRGGALIHRENAPPLEPASPTEVAEAVRIGPGTMPPFPADVLDDEQLDEVVAYVEYLAEPRDRGGYGLAHWGPATEALASFVALGLLLTLTGWLGERA